MGAVRVSHAVHATKRDHVARPLAALPQDLEAEVLANPATDARSQSAPGSQASGNRRTHDEPRLALDRARQWRRCGAELFRCDDGPESVPSVGLRRRVARGRPARDGRAVSLEAAFPLHARPHPGSDPDSRERLESTAHGRGSDGGGLSRGDGLRRARSASAASGTPNIVPGTARAVNARFPSMLSMSREWSLGTHQRDDSGDERRSEGRSAADLGPAPETCDRGALGRCEAHPGAVIRERCSPAVVGRGADRDHARKRGGEAGNVLCVIPSRSDDEHAGDPRPGDRMLELGPSASGAQADVHHRRPLVDRVVDRLRDVIGAREAARTEDLQWQDAAREAGADPAEPVVRASGCRSRHAGSVPIHRCRPGAVGEEVVAGEDCAGKLGMRRVDTGVDNRDDHVRRSRGDLPCGREVERGVRGVLRKRVAGYECGCGRGEGERRGDTEGSESPPVAHRSPR